MVAAIFQIHEFYNSRLDQIKRQTFDSARGLMLTVDREVASSQSALQALAVSSAFSTRDFSSIHKQASDLLVKFPGADIILADETGQQLVNSFRPFGSALPKRNNPDIVRRIFETGQPTVSDLFLGAVSKRPLVGVDVPVSAEGKTRYDLSMTFPAERIGAVLRQHHLPREWIGVIIDGKGVIIARTHAEEQTVGHPTSDILQHAISLSSEGTIESVTTDGIPVFSAFVRSPMSGWTVAIGVPTAILKGELEKWLWWSLGGAMLSALIGLGLASLIGRQIVFSGHRLAESEMRFRKLFEDTSQAITLIKGGYFVDANQATLKMLRLDSVDQLRSRSPADISPKYQPDGQLSAVKTEETINAALAEGNKKFEWVHLRADGEAFYAEVIATSIVIKDESYLHVVWSDITERKQTEDALTLQARRAEGLLNLPVLAEELDEIAFIQSGLELAEDLTRSQVSFIYIVSGDGNSIELAAWSRRSLEHQCAVRFDKQVPFNQAGIWKEVLGRKLPMIINEYSSSQHKYGLSEGQPELARLVLVPVVENGIVVMLAWVANKEWEYTESDKESIQLVANQIWLLIKKRRNDVELRISATAIESQDGTVICDFERKILRVNQAFCRITGYSEEEVVGRTTNFLKSGRHDTAFYKAMWESINRQGTWSGEIWNRRKNGEIYPEWLSIAAVKSVDGDVSHYVGTFSDASQRKEAENQIKQLAFFDPLTGLPNRRLLTDRLSQALASSARTERGGALLFVDLDDFKSVNDTQGHETGDLLLKQVALRLTANFREADTVARLGGDEFVVVLADLSGDPDEAATQVEIIGKKILETLGMPYQIMENKFRCTPSIGVTLFGKQHTNVDDLMRKSDIAMYQAKAAGRNTMRFFNPDLQKIINARAELESDLRMGVQEKQIILYYQPQVDVEGRLLGAEALVRWLHPQRGLVCPTEFIPLAEETGLILRLGQSVLDAGCAQIVAWTGRPEMSHFKLAINVSARQFQQADFVEQVLDALNRSGADPKKLKLELTESTLVENVQDVIEKMSSLKAKGIGFALDDFGTGYSSLSYLKLLPLDQLKIDRSFVRDVLTDPNDAAIARTIVALAQSLGLGVIAEGVETSAQRDFLATHGCNAYQGYLFGRPMPSEEFERQQEISVPAKVVHLPVFRRWEEK